MATFRRGHSARKPIIQNEILIAKIHGETTSATAGIYAYVDGLLLRGIPAIGRGVAGHITGTNPDHIARKDNAA